MQKIEAIGLIKGGIIGARETIMQQNATAHADRDSVRETEFAKLSRGFDMLTDLIDALAPAARPLTAIADAGVAKVAQVLDALSEDEADLLARYRQQKLAGAVSDPLLIAAPTADISNGAGYPAPAMGGAFVPADPSLMAVGGVVEGVGPDGQPAASEGAQEALTASEAQ